MYFLIESEEIQVSLWKHPFVFHSGNHGRRCAGAQDHHFRGPRSVCSPVHAFKELYHVESYLFARTEVPPAASMGETGGRSSWFLGKCLPCVPSDSRSVLLAEPVDIALGSVLFSMVGTQIQYRRVFLGILQSHGGEGCVWRNRTERCLQKLKFDFFIEKVKNKSRR